MYSQRLVSLVLSLLLNRSWDFYRYTMSRSRKKHGIYKDRSFKAFVYNKIFRRVNKQRLHSGKDLIALRELINSYDICDWIYRDENNPKLFRK